MCGRPAVLRQAVEACHAGVVPDRVAPFGVDDESGNATILTAARQGHLEATAYRNSSSHLSICTSGRLPFDRLIGFYPFGEINRAVSDMKARESDLAVCGSDRADVKRSGCSPSWNSVALRSAWTGAGLQCRSTGPTLFLLSA
jgi:hypothetical protein